MDSAGRPSRGRRERSLPLLAGAVALGLGVLGWLAAQLLTLYVLGHAHAGGDGHGFRHVHGWAAPIALGASAMVLASLVGLLLLPDTSARRGNLTRRRALRRAVLLPSAAFAVLDVAASAHAGSGLARTTASLILGIALQAAAGAGAALLARACIEWATAPSLRAVSSPLLPRRGPVPVEVPRLARFGYWQGAQGLRGPPRVVGF
ncbi:MAG: hypothetical protein ACT4QF_01755 [Sporichthyaceae bacterium]